MRVLITKRNIILLLAALMAGFGGIQGYSALTRKAGYEMATVQETAIAQSVDASGQINSENEVELSFPVSGKLIYLKVKKNDRVRKGSYIGSLDKRDLQKRLEESLRDYSKQRNNFEEMGQVTYRDQIITDAIKRILENNQWDLDKSVLDVELADIAQQDADLYSPMDGVVTKVQTPAGTSVTAATPIVAISDPDHIAFIAEVDESKIALVTVGQETTIALEAFPGKTFSGLVAGVDYAPSVATTGGKVYLVKITIEKVPGLKIGMSGDVQIVIAKHQDALVIPRRAIQEENGKKTVTVWENDKPRKQAVQVGLTSPTSVEIVDGLTSGQKLILGGGGL